MTSIPVPAGARRILGRRRARAAFYVGLAALVGALVANIAFADTELGTSLGGSASTGTVALAINAPATKACPTLNAVVPGDLPGTVTCTLSVTYTGSIGAYVGLNLLVVTGAGKGGSALFDGSNASGLTLAVSDGTTSFTVPTTPITGSACTALGGTAASTCYQTIDLAEVTGPSGHAGGTTWVSGDSATFTVTPRFPKTVTNANTYQGGTAAVTLSAQAVQAPANSNACAVGAPCAPGNGFSWN